MHNTEKVNLANVQMIAHRGVSGLERENTNAAFIAAGNRSYYGIETDAHRTKDGHYVIFHDDNMLRLTGIDRDLEGCTLGELRKKIWMAKQGLIWQFLHWRNIFVSVKSMESVVSWN